MTYRQRANTILGLSFVCFIAIFLWWYTHDVSVWEELLFFVIQSALIGSIADWFAVTALFEKPLGFPYHTELLYRHRDEIIDSMTKIISEKLLQPICGRISSIRFLSSTSSSAGCAARTAGKSSAVSSMKWRSGLTAMPEGRHTGVHCLAYPQVLETAASGQLFPGPPHFPLGRSEQPHVQRCHRPRAGTGQQ